MMVRTPTPHARWTVSLGRPASGVSSRVTECRVEGYNETQAQISGLGAQDPGRGAQDSGRGAQDSGRGAQDSELRA
jgi:hypothetical protein